MPGDPRTRGQPRSGTPPLEWAVAAIGAVILAGLVGYLAWYGLTHRDGPPELTVRMESVERVGEDFLVGFVVDNDGVLTAAAVQVKGALSLDGETVEESEATLDYVPQCSERRGGLIFTRDPGAHDLSLRVMGFADP